MRHVSPLFRQCQARPERKALATVENGETCERPHSEAIENLLPGGNWGASGGHLASVAFVVRCAVATQPTS
jgi:hypothetical protein